ncbi:hypothetical protein P692DRAFT_20171602 [Suillus brevipes Sb2]|nr:hypothetical protein P692DRAFT_20171602 [Suillus brevipes Sb2]
MPSALASQLAASASLNASLLDTHTRAYLFTGRRADVHGLNSIHALISNALAQSSSLSPAFTARNIKLAPDGNSGPWTLTRFYFPRLQGMSTGNFGK